MGDLGKLFIALGALLVIAGLVLVLLGRAHLPLGKLPGDIIYRGRNTTFYFPLATCIILSALLSLILYFSADGKDEVRIFRKAVHIALNDDRIHVAVVLEDDPGRDLGMLRQPGYRFFFSPEEIEPLGFEREVSHEG